MKLEVNENIKSDKNTKVFCQEPYAQELYDAYKNSGIFEKKFSKDIEKNEFLEITNVVSVKNNEIDFEVNNVSNITIDLNKEKRFLDVFNLDQEEFSTWIASDNGSGFLKQDHLIFVENNKPIVKGSLFLGHVAKQRKEFFDQINKPNTAYVAKIKSKNKGGFLVEVLGVEAFLPGSLAAANKIVDFDSYIGKEIPVMIEDYLNEIKTFIVSNKKYIKHILPQKIKEIDLTQKYKGTVTGVSKFGVFAEFDEIFTGLLHTSKMKKETREFFDNRGFKPNDEIECWVKEIGKNYRLVLSDYSPEETTELDKKEKEKKEKSFPIKINDIFEGTIISVKHFGTFVRIKKGKKDFTGLLLVSNKTKNNRKEPNDKVNVIVKAVKEGKIFFNLNED